LTGPEARAEVVRYLQGRRGLAQLVLAADQWEWRIHHSYWVHRLPDHPTLHVGLIAADATSIIVEIALGERPVDPGDPSDRPGTVGMVATSKLILASRHRADGNGAVSIESSTDQRILMHWFAPDRIPDPRVTNWRVQDL
jgi:hypothetical protein